MNMNYGRLNEDGSVRYAPDALKIGRRLRPSPKRADYIAEGWIPIDRSYTPADDPPEGKMWVRTGLWALYPGGEKIVPAFELNDIPPPSPRVFSKLKLFAALSQAGMWTPLSEWLKTQSINGMDAWTAFTLAQELSDGHPMFGPILAGAKGALGVSDEDAEAILAASLAD